MVDNGAIILTTIAAMLGGILAIVVSFSILLMQNAAQYSSAGFYDILAKDRLQSLIFWIIAIFTFILFVLAINFDYLHELNKDFAHLSTGLPIAILGIVPWLLYILYKRMYERIRPASSLLVVKKDTIKYLDQLNTTAREMAVVATKRPMPSYNVSPQIALATSFQTLQPHFNYLNTRIDHLFDYHDKLLSSQENGMAREALTTVYQILEHYFRLRSDSSVIVLSSDFLLVGISDSHGFLTPSLEQLVAKGNGYMRDDDDLGATHIIFILSNLVTSARNIKYTPNTSAENPIFAQCRGYLDHLLESAIKHNNIEVLFQGAIEYSKIGTVIVEDNLSGELLSTFKTLNKIAYHALSKHFQVVWGEVLNTYIHLLRKLMVSNHFNIGTHLRSLFEHLQAIVLLAYKSLQSGTLEDNFTIQTTLVKPFQHMERLVSAISDKVEKETEDKQQEEWRRVFFHLVKELRRCLRYLSEEMKNADHLLINTFGTVNANIGCLLLSLSTNEKWNPDREKLLNEVTWYLHQPEWFINHANKINANYSFDALVEAVAKMGIKSLQVGQDEIAKKSIETLSKFAISMLEKEKGQRYGFTEPRIMERACYVGILALKLGRSDLVQELKTRISTFQEAYEKEWFKNIPKDKEPTSPRRDQLSIEIIELRNDVIKSKYDHTRGLLDSSRDRLVEEVEAIDIDRFTREIWNFHVKDSPPE